MAANTLYVPATKIISDITNSNPAVVTTTVNHDYLSGEIIRIQVPLTHGMDQIDQEYAVIAVTGPTTFAIAIDTRAYAPFVIPVPQYQYAQTTAIGEVNEMLTAAVHNSLNPQDNI